MEVTEFWIGLAIDRIVILPFLVDNNVTGGQIQSESIISAIHVSLRRECVAAHADNDLRVDMIILRQLIDPPLKVKSIDNFVDGYESRWPRLRNAVAVLIIIIEFFSVVYFIRNLVDHAVGRHDAADLVRVRRDTLAILVDPHVHLVDELVHGEVEALGKVLLSVLFLISHSRLGEFSLKLYLLGLLFVR